MQPNCNDDLQAELAEANALVFRLVHVFIYAVPHTGTLHLPTPNYKLHPVLRLAAAAVLIEKSLHHIQPFENSI